MFYRLQAVMGGHERGQGLVEYALILALIVLVTIAALVVMGSAIGNFFNSLPGYL